MDNADSAEEYYGNRGSEYGPVSNPQKEGRYEGVFHDSLKHHPADGKGGPGNDGHEHSRQSH